MNVGEPVIVTVKIGDFEATAKLRGDILELDSKEIAYSGPEGIMTDRGYELVQFQRDGLSRAFYSTFTRWAAGQS